MSGDHVSSGLNSRLYYSTVMHHRFRPSVHRFTYRVGSFLLDLDELERLDQELTGFSYNRAGLFSVYDKDYVIDGQHDLKQHAQWLLSQQNMPSAVRIELLCMPRNLGYSFNPLCIFFCYDADDHLYATLYQVSNTFGEKHIYAVDAEPFTHENGEQQLRHQADKLFFVSPFINLSCQYRFRIHRPDERLKVLIRQEDPEGLLLNATLTGKSSPLTAKGLMRLCLKRPFFTYKVILGIHWEALQLWLKKVPYISRHQFRKPALTSKGQPLALSSEEE
ncbi:DUF1365 domain-containing protein [Oceanospirillum sediminis]|uniref:DUF1365 domain-containing protein n=1 Tax=Oceanospirillum sediminis TaxID=2760088 RepID=A0A839IPW1_9GAMM|nr:DUF1365 domain-containing protein [Oceanospirillum sediminis]MBB1486714.1 DUF1365 domain-containing protein [Oceanospirillum sediminis]